MVGILFLVLLSLSFEVAAFDIWKDSRRFETLPKTVNTSPEEVYHQFVVKLMQAKSAERAKEGWDSYSG